MKFSPPLIQARLIKRYKRFLADVVFSDGSESVAHCANTGSMLGLREPDSTIYLAPNTNPKAKLDYRWELIDVGSSLVGINTGRANAIVEEAINAGQVAALKGYHTLKREVKYGQNSRIDILLSDPEDEMSPSKCYVEVKSVTLADGTTALFPDSVTTRGAKHLNELIAMKKAGYRSVMLYLIQRSDCDNFRPAGKIDPQYEKELKKAYAAGVEILAYSCHVSREEISLQKQVPIDL